MNIEEIKKLKSSLYAMTGILNNLDQSMTEALDLCKQHRMLPNSLAAMIRLEMEDYQQQACVLEKVRQEHHLEENVELDLLTDALEQEAKACDAMAGRIVALRYLHLAAKVDKWAQCLEDSKQALLQLSFEPLNAFREALKPYAEVVRLVESGVPDGLASEDFELIEAGISKNVARAVDHDALIFDEAKDISDYVQSAGAMLTEDNSLPTPEQATPSETLDAAPLGSIGDLQAIGEAEDTPEEMPSAAEAEGSTALTVDEAASVEESVPAEDASQQQSSNTTRLFPNYSGYASEEVPDFVDSPAKNFTAKKTISRFKQHPEMLHAIFAMINTKVIDQKVLEIPSLSAGYKTGLQMLRDHEYIAEVAEQDEMYYVLTGKGYATVNNENVRSLIEKRETSYPRRTLLNSTEITEQRLQAFAAINRFDCFMGDTLVIQYSRCFATPSCVIGVSHLKEGELDRDVLLFPAWFIAGREQEAIDLLKEASKDDSLILTLVPTEQDIFCIRAYMNEQLSGISFFYIVPEQPRKWYDCDGVPINWEELTEEPDDDDDDWNLSDLDLDAADHRNEEEAPDVPSAVSAPEAEILAHDVSQQLDAKATKSDIVEQPKMTSTNPAPITPVTEMPPERASRMDSYRQVAWQAFAQGRSDVGCTMLQALCLEDNSFEQQRMQWGYATDDPAWLLLHDRRCSALQDAFPDDFGHHIGYDALGISAWIRMFFSTDACLEIYNEPPASLQQETVIHAHVPHLKELLFQLQSFRSEFHQGIDDNLLLAMGDHSGVSSKLSVLRKRADELLGSRLEESSHYTRQIKACRLRLFGPESWIRAGLTAISQDNRNTVKTIREHIVSLMSECSGCLHFNDKAVDQFLDDNWKAVSSEAHHKKHEALMGAEQNTLRRVMNHVLTVMADWVHTVETEVNQHTAQQLGQYQTAVTRVLNLAKQTAEEFKDAFQKTCAEDTAAIFVLQETLHDIIGRLQVGPDANASRFFYVRFLSGTNLPLDEDLFLPVMEPVADQIAPFDLCERIRQELLHDQQIDWSATIERIREPENEDDGHDYGTLRMIRSYLETRGEAEICPSDIEIDRDIKYCKTRAEERLQEFRAELEMADAYGWMESGCGNRLHVEQTIQSLQEVMLPRNDFGYCFRAMHRCIRYLRQAAREKLHDGWIEKLEQLETEHGPSDLSHQIRRCIDNDMYVVADSYMKQAMNGHETIQRGIPHDVTETFRQFIENYDKDYPRVRQLKQPLSAIFMNRHRGTPNQTIKTGEVMLRNWPESDNIPPQKIEQLLAQMDLPVHVTKNGTRNYTADFDHRPPALNYQHPIAAFGTTMFEKGLEIVIIVGNKGAEQMQSECRKVMEASHQRSVLILANTAMALSERRLLAAKIRHENKTPVSFLLMDRVMALFVAEAAKTERWDTLLRCGLPFQYLNPYSENSTTPIPPEMFFGRQMELQQIMDWYGANLVYGGRQLGKTALLRRAEQQLNHPESGSYAVWVDIGSTDREKAAERIINSLQSRNIFATDLHDKSWDSLLNGLEKWLRDKGHSLMLLLDEADEFLRISQADHYRTLEDLRRLQGIAPGRFKFVMAGLHNVMRLNRKTALENNSVIPQLGAITVKPLNYLEADELLERPLSYLGFKIEQSDEQSALIALILSSANYFPGLIHIYASRLITAVCSQARSNVSTEPPYPLNEKQILKLMQDEKFLEKRKEKFEITLGLTASEHQYYGIIANILGHCIRELSGFSAVRGITVRKLMDECDGLGITAITMLDLQQLETLMDELRELNILRSETIDGINYYNFTRPSFLEMLGSIDQIENQLYKYMEKEDSEVRL